MKQQNLPRIFEQETTIVLGSEWELCRAYGDVPEIAGHLLKLRFGNEIIIVGLFNNDNSPGDKEREEIAKYIVFAAAQFAENVN